MPNSEIVNIQRKVFHAALKWAVEENTSYNLPELAREIIPDNSPKRYRCCIHKERAVIEERLKAIIEPEDGPIVRVLKEGCNGCEMHRYTVTDLCQNCVGHFCSMNCPKKAIVFINDKAFIDQSRCIECGICARNCPYNAIIEYRRPCEESCPTKAISVRENRIARIKEEDCTNCGKCIVNCPFGAVVETSQIVDLARDLKSPQNPIYGIIAPAFVGQFGRKVAPGQVKSALLKLGFKDVVEAAVGADLTVELEVSELKERLEQGEKFMTSSCCPAYTMAVEKKKPELYQYISTTQSPMVQTAKLIKERIPEAKVTFIGPCIAKKEEGQRPESQVDYVITFEELMAWFEFKGIDLMSEPNLSMEGPSSFGRGFSKAGGVAQALVNKLGDDSFPTYQTEGVLNSLKALEEHVNNNDSGFLECMACDGGCIGGPRRKAPRGVAIRALKEFCS
ncbi:MAG: 4Fe-4S binding protein [Desulfitobacterium sp.]|nr:4Fe-4S binding protein [Desulfitobacterium sp.]